MEAIDLEKELIELRNRVTALEAKQAQSEAVGELTPRIVALEGRANDNQAAWNTLAEALRPKA